MASIIKVDTIKDTSDNTLLTSSSGNVSISNDLSVSGDSSVTGNVGVGETTPLDKMHIYEAVNNPTATQLLLQNEGGGSHSAGIAFQVSDSAETTGFAPKAGIVFERYLPNGGGRLKFFNDGVNDTNGFSAGDEVMRIDASGNLLVSKTTANSTTTEGASFDHIGDDFALRIVNTNTSSGQAVMLLNRQNSDGGLITFRHANTTEGSIGVSGTTVNYAGFTGTHWSRLSDNSKPTILKGTILESLDEMMDWYQVQFDIIDEEGKTRTEKESYALGDGESVGDVITYNYEGTDYQATIIQEDDIKHTKSKISDTVDAKNVYGVFVDWDDGDDTVNDMYVAQTGSYVIRINGSETVSKGDLIQSNGDGTGKVQADDIIRASTVAKVLSTTKIETYDDGSYIVPCSLHC